MNLCPFCDIEFLSEDELSAHIYQEHPEKTGTAEAVGQAMGEAFQRITSVQDTRRLAAHLTSIALGNRGVDPAKVEEVFVHFLEFLDKLDKKCLA